MAVSFESVGCFNDFYFSVKFRIASTKIPIDVSTSHQRNNRRTILLNSPRSSRQTIQRSSGLLSCELNISSFHLPFLNHFGRLANLGVHVNSVNNSLDRNTDRASGSSSVWDPRQCSRTFWCSIAQNSSYIHSKRVYSLYWSY